METPTSVGAGYWASSGLEHNSDLCRGGDVECAIHQYSRNMKTENRHLLLPDLDLEILLQKRSSKCCVIFSKHPKIVD